MSSSTLLPLALNFVTKVSIYEFAALAPLASTAFRHHVYPSSLGTPAEGVTLEEWIQSLTHFRSLITTIGLDVENPISVLVAEKEKVVILHLKSNGKTASGADYKNEYNVTVKFDKEDKIVRVDEWVDSAFVRETFGNERKLAAERAASQ